MAKRATITLSVPAGVETIWEAVTDRTARQLFHASESKRLAAVTALARKHPGRGPRAELLLAAAPREPASAVRAAMLSLVATAGYYVAWRACVRLRADVPIYVADPDPAVRAALAQCIAVMAVPMVADDVGWIAAMVASPDEATDAVFASAAVMLVRMVRQGVAVNEASAVLARMALHPQFGYHARMVALAPGPLRAVLAPALVAWIEAAPADAFEVASILARCGPGPHGARAVAVLEALRARQGDNAWVVDLFAGMVDRASLAERLARHVETLDGVLTEGSSHPVALEAMSWEPTWIARYASRCAFAVMTVHMTDGDAVRARWIAAAAAPMAVALRPHLDDRLTAPRLLPWWERLSPDTAVADALAWIERVLASGAPHEVLHYEFQHVADACCALLVRVGAVPPGALARLAALASRQAVYILATTLPTVRAMHALGASADDFAPLVTAYLERAEASDARAAREPQWDPERVGSANLRRLAAVLPALGARSSLCAVRSQVEALFASSLVFERTDLLTVLTPHLDEPWVRALFEGALASAEGDSLVAAHALGLAPTWP